MESLFRALSKNPRGLLRVQDEPSALILGLNQSNGEPTNRDKAAGVHRC
jgi:hypothetical protein